MDFRRESARGASQCLIRRFGEMSLRGSRRAGVRSHDRTVHHHAFHVGIVGEMAVHGGPDAFVSPPDEALVHAVPFPSFRREQSPLRSAAKYPKHRFDELSADVFRPDVDRPLGSEEKQYLAPIVIR
jgi:hypothetical protein